MIRGLPPKIQDALETLWSYADDGCISGMTKAELDEEGYKVEGKGGHFITFVVSYSKNKRNKA